MRTKNKLFSFFTFVLIFVMLSNTVMAKDYSKHWAKSAIEKWYDKGIVKGYTDGTFKPNNAVTRAEFAAIMQRLFNLRLDSNAKKYSDVLEGKWYTSGVRIIASHAVMNDYGTTFKPNQVITREEAAYAIANLYSVTEKLDKSFTDHKKISSWAVNQVYALAGANGIKGKPYNKFDPQGLLSRAELITIIDNMTSELFDKSGSYKGEANKELSRVIINSADVSLADYKISKDLYISESAGKEDLKLTNLSVAGTTFVLGNGKQKGIIIKNSTMNKLEVDRDSAVLKIENSSLKSINIVKNNVNLVFDTNSGLESFTIASGVTASINGTKVDNKTKFEEITALIKNGNPSGTGGSTGTTPGGNTDTNPGGSTGTTPGGNTNTNPGGSTGTTPGGNTDTNPGGSTGTTPGGNTDTNPGGSTGTTPGGNTDTNPGGSTGTTPGGNTDTNPGGSTGTTPGGNTDTNLGGSTGTTPGGNTDTNPGGNTETTPSPNIKPSGTPGTTVVTLVDSKNSPVANYKIELKGKVYTTDANGSFITDVLPNGEYEFSGDQQVSSEGFAYYLPQEKVVISATSHTVVPKPFVMYREIVMNFITTDVKERAIGSVPLQIYDKNGTLLGEIKTYSQDNWDKKLFVGGQKIGISESGTDDSRRVGDIFTVKAMGVQGYEGVEIKVSTNGPKHVKIYMKRPGETIPSPVLYNTLITGNTVHLAYDTVLDSMGTISGNAFTISDGKGNRLTSSSVQILGETISVKFNDLSKVDKATAKLSYDSSKAGNQIFNSSNSTIIVPSFTQTLPFVLENKAADDLEKEVLRLVNIERAKQNLKPLQLDPTVGIYARMKANDLAVINYFDHESPIYGAPANMASTFGYQYYRFGENIARGQWTPEEVMKDWMNSDGHRANIMRPEYTHIGIGYNATSRTWVQMFSVPR